jgi:hypothetical protein
MSDDVNTVDFEQGGMSGIPAASAGTVCANATATG